MQINYSINEIIPERLQAFFARHQRLAIAFSGGSDSAYLLYAAKLCGADMGAYYVKSQFQAAFEYDDALRLARGLEIKLHTVHLDVLGDANIVSNPENRCYHCKRRIFEAIIAAAKADGYDAVIDGTNASDDASDRPGMRALEELGILSPLRECGVTKADLRLYSQRAGLFTWNKPAYACLATRIPCGMSIDAGMLCRIESAEEALSRMGFSDFRVRIMQDLSAKIQINKAQLDLFMASREKLLRALENDFDNILLDLRLRGE